MAKKPTGTSGLFRTQIDDEGNSQGKFNKIEYRTEKEAIELHAIECFITSMNREIRKCGEEFYISNPALNEQNDFDATVQTPEGKAYMELRELHPGGRYEGGTTSIDEYDFAKIIFDAIQKKSARYSKPECEFFLLLYSTHFAHTMGYYTLMCVRKWLADKPPIFTAVFSYEPLDEKEGISQWLYPYPPDLLGDFDPESVRGKKRIVMDLGKAELESGKDGEKGQ